MVLDPLSALSLAGTIFQLVDFSFKLITGARAIYHSVDGSTKENLALSVLAEDLQKLSDALHDPAVAGPSASIVSIAGFQTVAVDAKQVAQELLDVLASLELKKPNSKWSSFKIALRQVWSEEKIKDLVSRITRLQGTITNKLLIVLRDQNSEAWKALESIECKIDQLHMHGAREVTTLRLEVKDAVNRLNSNSRLEHSTVASHLKRIEEEAELSRKDVMLLSSRINTLVSSLQQLYAISKSTSYNLAVLQSLYFDKIQHRYEAVPNAHAQTFRWIFEDILPATGEPLGFLDWLNSQGGIYWVMGKPGSGKSTLMKFLCQEQRTLDELRIWAGTKKLIFGSFFFWNSGSALQKSQEGLLRSLLFEILRQYPSFIQQLWPRSHQGGAEEFAPRDWHRSVVYSSFKQLLEFDTMPAKFCFFIDGPDEYECAQEGDHSELIKILEIFTASPDVKLCLSSRPWYVFKDAFGRDSKRYIKLEDLTRDDIKRYIHSRFEESSRYRELEAKDPAYAELETEVVNRAQGVFLWVYLVIQSLLRGFTYADDISTLKERLRALPDGLDDFFQHMLDTVEPIYRPKTARIFQICSQAFAKLGLLTYWYLDDERNLDLDAEILPLTREKASRNIEDMRRRLDGRTKGLLEVTKRPSETYPSYPFLAYEVDFLHRTAKDFVESTNVQHILKPYIPSGFEPHTLIMKALLCQLKAFYGPDFDSSLNEKDNPKFMAFLNGMLQYERTVEETPDPPFDILFQILAKVEEMVYERARTPRERTSFVGLLVQQRHLRYIRWRAKRLPQIIQLQDTESSNRPLLDYACDPGILDFSDITAGLRSRTLTLPEPSHMIEALIEAGEHPNMVYFGRTIWQRFMLRIYDHRFEPDTDTSLKVLGMAEQMIRGGASKSDLISTALHLKGKKYGDITSNAGQVTLSAENILRDKLILVPSSEIDRVLQIEKVCQIEKSESRSWVSWLW